MPVCIQVHQHCSRPSALGCLNTVESFEKGDIRHFLPPVRISALPSLSKISKRIENFVDGEMQNLQPHMRHSKLLHLWVFTELSDEAIWHPVSSQGWTLSTALQSEDAHSFVELSETAKRHPSSQGWDLSAALSVGEGSELRGILGWSITRCPNTMKIAQQCSCFREVSKVSWNSRMRITRSFVTMKRGQHCSCFRKMSSASCKTECTYSAISFDSKEALCTLSASRQQSACAGVLWTVLECSEIRFGKRYEESELLPDRRAITQEK